MAEQLLSPDLIKAATPALNFTGYPTKVLDDYFVRGRLKTIPSQLKKREAILRHLAEEFEPSAARAGQPQVTCA